MFKPLSANVAICPPSIGGGNAVRKLLIMLHVKLVELTMH